MSNVETENTDSLNAPAAPTPKARSNYEVVFFVRYKYNPRPSAEVITNYFSKYGTVDHVNCPPNSNYAFVFMKKLSIMAEHRRTRNTISQIIQDMTPENKFHITVASSNRNNETNRLRRYNFDAVRTFVRETTADNGIRRQ